MMRPGLMLFFALLGACQDRSGTTDRAENDTKTTAALLEQGAPQTCAQGDVRDTVITNIKPQLRPSENLTGAEIEAAQAALTYSIDTIALASVERSVHSISCDANLTIHYKDHDDRTFSIRYVVRPSVDEAGSFVVTTNAGDAADYAQTTIADSVAAVKAAKTSASSQVANLEVGGATDEDSDYAQSGAFTYLTHLCRTSPDGDCRRIGPGTIKYAYSFSDGSGVAKDIVGYAGRINNPDGAVGSDEGLYCPTGDINELAKSTFAALGLRDMSKVVCDTDRISHASDALGIYYSVNLDGGE